MPSVKDVFARILSRTPYEIRRRLPRPSLTALTPILAIYRIAGAAPSVVQVGACDGVSEDPLHEFLQSARGLALAIEPIPGSFETLKQRYSGNSNVKPIQCAIAAHDGNAVLFTVRKGASSIKPYWADQIASFSKGHLRKHGIPDEDILPVQVPCFTLATLLDKEGFARCDLLQIDAEGFDGEIVKMALQLPAPPECIHFEYRHLDVRTRTEVFALLAARGYSWTHDHWNTLALHRSFQKRWFSFS